MNAAKSWLEPSLASTPSLLKAALHSGEPSTALISALSLATTGAGVPAGAHSPAQKLSDRPGKPLSIMVGTSGSSG